MDVHIESGEVCAMVFRKFKPQKQWGKMDTRIFKNILAARNKRKMPRLIISPAVEEAGIKIYDPNRLNFFTTEARELPVVPHPAHRIPQLDEHPLYKSIECSLFDGTVAFTDGIDQACALSKAVKRIGFPEAVSNLASKIPLPECFEDHLSDCIMHGERYDPTLEKLPRLFDPVIFWANYFPYRVHGTPMLTRGKIILDNLFRTAHLMALQHSQLLNLRYDRDEPLSAILQVDTGENEKIPFVLRLEPHIIVQCPEPIRPWTKAVGLTNIRVPDTAPINPRIDLTSDHIYNDSVVLPRAKENLFIDTVLWCHEQNQKYPWTVEQLGAKAIMVCFGAAVAQATRLGQSDFDDLENQPVVTRTVQFVNGRLDLVVFQLNTLDLGSNSRCKNIVWIEPGLQLYKSGKFTENLDVVKDLNVDTFRKFMALLLVR
uniref:Large ribosomal subunit protein mL37 n=2 Tax=Onchocerca volvulus TaxID=6282 RepID=A0A8R1TJ30_ONCVO